MTIADIINSNSAIIKHHLDGKSDEEISSILSIPVSQVEAILRSPIVEEKIKSLQEQPEPDGDLMLAPPITEGAKSVEEISPQEFFRSCQSQVARQLLQEALGGDNSAARIKASSLILEACKPKDTVNHLGLDSATINSLKEALNGYKNLTSNPQTFKHIRLPGVKSSQPEGVPLLEPPDVNP